MFLVSAKVTAKRNLGFYGHWSDTLISTEEMRRQDTNWKSVQLKWYHFAMNKRTSQWFIHRIMLIAGAFIFVVFAALAQGQPIPDPREEGYDDDQVLYQAPLVPDSSTTSPLTIESKGDQTNLSVETRTRISPYLGAVNKQADRPENISPRLDNKTDNPFKNYHLETGVGLHVDEQTEINLGYRFNDTSSLLDNDNSESSGEDGGEIRFSLEFKLPF